MKSNIKTFYTQGFTFILFSSYFPNMFSTLLPLSPAEHSQTPQCHPSRPWPTAVGIGWFCMDSFWRIDWLVVSAWLLDFDLIAWLIFVWVIVIPLSHHASQRKARSLFNYETTNIAKPSLCTVTYIWETIRLFFRSQIVNPLALPGKNTIRSTMSTPKSGEISWGGYESWAVR